MSKPANARKRPDVTFDEVIKTARDITKDPTARAITLVPATKIAAMAATVTCLDDIAVLAAKLLLAKPEQTDAARTGLAGALGALGYLTLVAKENTYERQD